MNVKVLLCNCKGLCPSFKDADFNTLLFQLESELNVEYVVLNPMVCGQGGNRALSDVLKAASGDKDTYVISGACAPEAQEKLFAKILKATGFPPERFVTVDIRGTDNDGIVKRLSETVNGLSSREKSVTA
ncbi:MAG: hypothetical protein ACUVRO_10025 [Armatimonadota bacterium]